MSSEIPNNRLSKIKVFRTNAENFLYGPLYAPFVMLCVLFAYVGNFSLYGLGFIVLLGCFVVLFSEDLTPLLPILFSVMMVFSDLSVFSSIWTFCIFIPFVGCMIAHYFMYPIKKIKLGKMFFPFLAVLVAFLCGGLLSPTLNAYVLGLPLIGTIGVALFAEYFILRQQICPPEGVDVKKYFCYTLIWTALLASAELLCVLLLEGQIIPTTSIHWCNTNHIGYILLLAMPANFYLMIKNQNVPVHFFLTVIFVVACLLTKSDASLALLCLFTCLLTIFSIKRLSKQNAILLLLLMGVCIIGVIVLFIVLSFVSPSTLDTFFFNLLSPSKRHILYESAIENFLKAPIFGGSLGLPTILGTNGNNFHSLILHILATLGIFGLIAYAYNFIIRIKIFTTKTDSFNEFMLVAFIMYELYAFIDTGEFVMLMIFMVALILFVEIGNTLPRTFNDKLKANKNLKGFIK